MATTGFMPSTARPAANVTAGGAGSAVGELLAAEGVAMPLLHIGIPDRFVEHGSREDCLAAAGLDFGSVAGAVERWWALQPQERSPTSKVG
jgi:1-deoxy-D-xylulose-5-phosphate synthase